MLMWVTLALVLLTLHVLSTVHLFAGLGRGHKPLKQTFMVQWY